MKKIILLVIFAGFLVLGGGIFQSSETNIGNSFTVYAQGSDFDGIIPSVKESEGDTKELARKIQTGRVNIADIIFIIVKMIDLVTKLAGTIAVIFLIYGGYQYMIGSVSDDKEGAKKTIQYAVTGLIVTFMAYLIVNLVKVQFLGG